MSRVNTKDLKDKIESELRKIGVNEPDIILVSSGCLVQVINQKDKIKQIFEQLTELHRNLNKGESAFPFKIYNYDKAEDAFKISVGLKTKPHDYETGHHTSYLMAQDAIAEMREIDTDALMYGEFRPFGFIVRSKPDNEPFSISDNVKYKELDVSGGHYNLENAKIEKMSSRKNEWKITLL